MTATSPWPPRRAGARRRCPPTSPAGRPRWPCRSTRWTSAYKLASNENPFDPLPSVRAAIADASAGHHALPRPPRRRAARGAGRPARPRRPSHVSVGCGSVGLLQQLLLSFADPGERGALRLAHLRGLPHLHRHRRRHAGHHAAALRDHRHGRAHQGRHRAHPPRAGDLAQQPHRHRRPPRRAGRAARGACPSAAWWCSTRPTTSTSPAVTLPRALELLAQAPEPGRPAHLLQGLRAGRPARRLPARPPAGGERGRPDAHPLRRQRPRPGCGAGLAGARRRAPGAGGRHDRRAGPGAAGPAGARLLDARRPGQLRVAPGGRGRGGPHPEAGDPRRGHPTVRRRGHPGDDGGAARERPLPRRLRGLRGAARPGPALGAAGGRPGPRGAVVDRPHRRRRRQVGCTRNHTAPRPHRPRPGRRGGVGRQPGVGPPRRDRRVLADRAGEGGRRRERRARALRPREDRPGAHRRHRPGPPARRHRSTWRRRGATSTACGPTSPASRRTTGAASVATRRSARWTWPASSRSSTSATPSSTSTSSTDWPRPRAARRDDRAAPLQRPGPRLVGAGAGGERLPDPEPPLRRLPADGVPRPRRRASVWPSASTCSTSPPSSAPACCRPSSPRGRSRRRR